MAGKKASSDGRGSAKSTPVKQKQMKNKKACDVSSAPCSPAGRGTPRRAMASKAVEKMKKMAVKAEDMDEDDAFDGDEDYDQAPTSRGRTTPKKFKARVVNGSAPSTPMSKRCVMVVFFTLASVDASIETSELGMQSAREISRRRFFFSRQKSPSRFSSVKEG